MSAKAFNAKVAARTRVAVQITETPDLLTKYEKVGGLRRDLETIAKFGMDAEAANLGQSQAKASGKAATIDVLVSFASLQKEYAGIMAAVDAVRSELEFSGASAEIMAKTDAIIKNEVPLSIKTYEKDGVTKRTARKLRTQEALRAEIAKDAAALLEMTDIHRPLSERQVDPARLQALKESAEKLSGLLSNRAATKGASRTATKEEREAVEKQEKAWHACVRLLKELGNRDERVRTLLKEAA
ncbi:MAG: hypothetical protein JW768_05380 [Chitinispirillaceae bacterium]|nr:hypothetical protein [Chitinispirillaceae bacterium]